MTFAAEPYGVFVDDLLTGLTGGIARESFVFLATDNPFRLTPPGPVRPKTVRIHGIVKEAFHIARTGRPGPVLIDIPKDISEGEPQFIGGLRVRNNLLLE